MQAGIEDNYKKVFEQPSLNFFLEIILIVLMII